MIREQVTGNRERGVISWCVSCAAVSLGDAFGGLLRSSLRDALPMLTRGLLGVPEARLTSGKVFPFIIVGWVCRWTFSLRFLCSGEYPTSQATKHCFIRAAYHVPCLSRGPQEFLLWDFTIACRRSCCDKHAVRSLPTAVLRTFDSLSPLPVVGPVPPNSCEFQSSLQQWYRSTNGSASWKSVGLVSATRDCCSRSTACRAVHAATVEMAAVCCPTRQESECVIARCKHRRRLRE